MFPFCSFLRIMSLVNPYILNQFGTAEINAVELFSVINLKAFSNLSRYAVSNTSFIFSLYFISHLSSFISFFVIIAQKISEKTEIAEKYIRIYENIYGKIKFTGSRRVFPCGICAETSRNSV